jgi:hypothetical protein
MYKITYSRRKIDGSIIIDYLPEIRTYAAQLFRFRSTQPGYVSFTHGLTDDQLATYGVLLFESEAAFNDCMAAEESDAESQAARAALQAFGAENDIATDITYETI